MKRSKVEILQGRIAKTQERLEKAVDTVKALKQEIAKLEKEKEEAEMDELQGFMKEYDISPLAGQGDHSEDARDNRKRKGGAGR